MKLEYSIFGNLQVSAEIRNTKEGIEISDVKGSISKHAKEYEIINQLLYPFIPRYSKIAVNTSEGKKLLAIEIEKEIKNIEKRLEEHKLALKMCKRKKYYFKPKN